jgi:hypothetical protein
MQRHVLAGALTRHVIVDVLLCIGLHIFYLQLAVSASQSDADGSVH